MMPACQISALEEIEPPLSILANPFPVCVGINNTGVDCGQKKMWKDIMIPDCGNRNRTPMQTGQPLTLPP